MGRTLQLNSDTMAIYNTIITMQHATVCVYTCMYVPPKPSWAAETELKTASL